MLLLILNMQNSKYIYTTIMHMHVYHLKQLLHFYYLTMLVTELWETAFNLKHKYTRFYQLHLVCVQIYYFIIIMVLQIDSQKMDPYD